MDKFPLSRDNEALREGKAHQLENDAQTGRLRNETGADKNIPRAAPRVSHYRATDINDSNLDMDIEELLEIQ